ncbi:major outer membrane protein [Campylobacter concisus]|uniref:major outer membrane protein n=1 Tax=Campylobacter concisus TaxID=199 RepID=UPI000CD944D1|nr:major outer membrane protein [Campylobacter concisus]MDU2009442.1 major outer membrane protein [Campylobacter concisus]
MKLTKISLATLVALGAFSSVASATPLEEAIKNVDLSGFARYRYTNTHEKNTVAKNVTKGSVANHQFRMVTNFKAAIDDNFFGVIGLRYSANDGSGDNATGTDLTNTTGTFNVHQFYLGYNVGGTTITAGKQVIGSYFTDDAVGTGIRVVNKDIEGLTLTALAFDAIENEWADGDLHKEIAAKSYDVGNLYAAGIAGSYDPVNFQLWYASLTNLADLLGADVSLNFAITDDVKLGARLNYVNSTADVSAKSKLGYNDGNFYAGELSTSLFGFDLAGGYIGWKSQDKAISAFTFEDQGGLIDAGEDVFDWTHAEGRGNFFYATSAYTFDKFTAGLDYVRGNIKTAGVNSNNDRKEKIEEFVPRFAYQYNKKLKFSSFYAFKTSKDGSDKDKTDKFRFEAKYSF